MRYELVVVDFGTTRVRRVLKTNCEWGELERLFEREMARDSKRHVGDDILLCRGKYRLCWQPIDWQPMG